MSSSQTTPKSFSTPTPLRVVALIVVADSEGTLSREAKRDVRTHRCPRAGLDSRRLRQGRAGAGAGRGTGARLLGRPLLLSPRLHLHLPDRAGGVRGPAPRLRGGGRA